jgi:hypothetical protein
MSDLNQTPDETRPEEPTHDIERGSDETIKHSAHQVSPDVNISERSHSNVMYNAMYQALMVTPWGIDNILKIVLPKPTISPPPHGSPRSAVLGALIGIVVGAALEAPIGIGFACLENVVGSWLMRLHHSHEAYAFHGASSLGNYAIAGAIAALPGMAILVTVKACLSTIGYKKFTMWYGFVLMFAFSAAEGAAASAIGTARGFKMQTVVHSAIANVAGAGFIIVVLLPFLAIYVLFGITFEWFYGALTSGR